MNPLRHSYMAFRSALDILSLRSLAPLKQPCYKENKGALSILADHIIGVARHGAVERGYWMYNFHKKPRKEQKAYIDYVSFMSKRNELNMHPKVTFTTGEKFNYICLLRDKFLFGRLLSQLGFPVAEDILLLDGKNSELKEIHNLNTASRSLDCIVDYEFDAFCKIVSGECGRGVFKLACRDGRLSGEVSSVDELKSLIGKSMFILQKRLTQHNEINRIYPRSINTIRLITCMSADGHTVTPLPAVIRFGANGNVVDNWAAGGLIVAIDEKGYLKGNGIYEFPVNGVIETAVHPDTKIRFDGIKIPFYDKAIETACNLHRYIYGIPCIGWDIAITENGVAFIEGNDNFEITLNQAAHGGLKNKWIESIGVIPPRKLIDIQAHTFSNLCMTQAA